MNKANMKLLSLYEILLGTHFDHRLQLLEPPRGALHKGNFDIFYLTPPTEHLWTCLNVCWKCRFLSLFHSSTKYMCLTQTLYVLDVVPQCYRANNRGFHLAGLTDGSDTILQILHLPNISQILDPSHFTPFTKIQEKTWKCNFNEHFFGRQNVNTNKNKNTNKNQLTFVLWKKGLKKHAW